MQGTVKHTAEVVKVDVETPALKADVIKQLLRDKGEALSNGTAKGKADAKKLRRALRKRGWYCSKQGNTMKAEK